jgi:hypothetical protein
MITEKINSKDISYLQSAFSINEIALFSNAILKTEIKNTQYFMFPYLNEEGKEGSYKLFNLNFRKNIGLDKNSYWSNSLNLNNTVNILLIGDDPLSLIRYYSNNKHLFRNKSITFIAPYSTNYDSISIIKKQYKPSEKIITVFDTPGINEVQKLICSAVYSNKDLKFEKNGPLYKISSGNKFVEVEEINFYKLKELLYLRSAIKHKNNK